MDKDVKPKVSIIMPVYNLDKYINEAMDSVINQTFQDWELLVADDGSLDKTRDILASYAKKDKRIVFLKRDEHLGLIGNLNDMITRARSDLIARMDGDDFSFPDRLAIQYDYMQKHTKCILSGTWVEMIDEKGKVLQLVRYPVQDWLLRARMLVSDQFMHGSVMFRKEFAVKVGGYPEYKVCEDYALWARMMKFGKITNIPQVLYKWRQHDHDNQTERMVKQRESTARLKDEMRKDVRYMPERLLLIAINLYQRSKKWILKLFK